MFDKKIILLISLLLITGSSYFILHRKKNNDDEVNIIDDSDNSINEEESVNEDVESSSSLLLIIIIIVVIIIAVAIFFYHRNKIKGDFFEEYKRFKEVEANKQKILSRTKDEGIRKIVESFQKAVSQEYADLIKKKYIKGEDYNTNKYLIDCSYHFSNNQLKNPYQENNKPVYRFNAQENPNFFNEILFNFFAVIVEEKNGIYKDIYEEYKDGNFDNENEDDKKEAMFLFIATIIEPFFKAIQEGKYKTNNNDVYIFISRKDNDTYFLRFLFANASVHLLQSEVNENEKSEISWFFEYAKSSRRFLTIFNKLIESYFPSDFVPEKKIS